MKKTNKLISILLVLAMLLSVTPLSFITSAAAEITPTEPTLTTDKYDVNGDDTKDAVYEITTASELYWFAGLVNGTLSGVTKNNSANAILMNNITVNENVIVDGALTTDISNLVVWTAIGKSFSSTSQFKGHFDGNNKTISGLYVNDTVTYRGFVGYLGGSVKNLTIADSYFYSTNTSLGAIAGSAASGSSIENCKLTGSIVSGKGSVGGIVGYVAAGVTLTNCHTSESEISGTADKIGGIVGSAGGNNSSNKSYIRLCAITDSSVNGASDVGGILGRGGSLSYTYIIGCCNYGTDVTATTKNAGGIVGYYAAIYSSFSSAKVSAPTKQGPFYGASANAYASAYDSTVYGEAINYVSSKCFTTDEIKSGIAAYYLANSTSSSTNAYSQWGQKIGEDEYPVWNADNNADYIVYREDDPDAEGGYRYYNGDAAAAYEPNEDGIYEITNRLDWYKFAKKSKEDPTISGILTDNIDFSAVISDKIGDYRIGEDDAYTGSFDGDGYTVSGLPQMELPLFDTIGSGGELKNLTLSGATVNYISSTPAVGLVENNNGTVSGCAVSDITIIGSTSSAMIGTNRGTVTNCTATNITVAGKSAAAGIVYLNTGTIEKCNVVSGTVKAVHTENYDSHAGGICVRSGAGTIRECSNNADVTAESSSTVIYAAAGIVAAPSDSSGASVQVTKCSNSGDIKGGYAGGISGYDNTSAYVNISLCYNEGAITGGIAGGIAASGSYNASDKILNCYNAGDVNATSKAGGIAGEQGNCIIENCHNYAKIVSSNVGASIVGYSSGVWPGPDKLINNHAIEGNVEASYVSPYLDTKGAASNFDAITVGSTREEFADGTITAKLNAGNSETVWYQHSEYPILEQRHMHKWEYSLVGTDSIKAKCVNAGCDLDNNDGGSMTIVAPAELVYDGTSKDADCTYNEWKPGKPAIVYNDIDRTNVTGQNIVASVTAGEATASVSYQIQPCEIIASMVTLSKTSVSYNGTEQSTTVTVKYDTNTTLTASVDYEITGTTSATEISTGDGYAVTVTGKGNYIGTVTKYWKINKGSLSTQLILEGWNYLDTPNEPYVTNNPENAEVTYTYYISTGRRPVMTGSANGAETEGGVPSYAGTYYIGAVIAATEHYNSKTISPVAFTIAPREVSNPDFEGLQETYLYDNGNEIKPAFTLKDDEGNVISDSEYTVVYSDNTDAGKATITITDNAGGNYNVSGSTKFTIITHQHDWIYSANGDTITAICANTDTGCLDTNGGTLKIFAPADLYADGTTAKEATVENNLADTSVAVNVTYSTADGSAPKTAGTYTASVTVGGATATVEFTLLNYAAKVTDKDGNAVGTYKTFADAITAAQGSEDSTLTLLDDVTLTEEQYVYSGKFTLELNGKKIISENYNTLYIFGNADFTINDSSEGGTIESKEQGYYAVYNYGTLTVESGVIKGDGGISNIGTLIFKNGKIEAGTYSAIINSDTAYVYNGILESSDESALYNDTDSTLYVYDGEFSGNSAISNRGSAYIEGGEFTGKAVAALNLHGGTVEVTGGSFTGTDFSNGYYSGTPYGEWTVCYNEDATLILKGGEFPNGFVVDETTANTFLAEDYYYKDADGKLIDVADDAKIINGYVKVSKGADLADAVITVDKTEFVYNGQHQAPDVTVTIGGKTLTENVDYVVNARRWENGVPVQWFYYVDAGVYTSVIIGSGDYTGTVEKEFVIKPATVDIIWEGDEFYYTGNPHKVTAKYVDVNGDENPAAITQNKTNTEIGKYIATAVVEDANYTVNGATINHAYEIKWYDGAPDATVSGTKGENGWYTSEVTVTAPEGYTISTAVDGTYDSEITFGNEENAVYYLKQTENGYIAKVELSEIKCDLADPVAEITMAENKWNSFFNTVTFGYFFKETQSITITASDETSGIAKIEYVVATEEITDFENAEWIEYTEAFTIQPNSKNVIYAKVTDNAGRYVIVNSDGIVLYTDSQAVTSEATYILTSMEDVEFEIDFNGNEVAYIMYGGSYLDYTQYTATENGIKLHANYIENAYTAGEYQFTVYVDPLGENFGYEGIGYLLQILLPHLGLPHLEIQRHSLDLLKNFWLLNLTK